MEDDSIKSSIDLSAGFSLATGQQMAGALTMPPLDLPVPENCTPLSPDKDQISGWNHDLEELRKGNKDAVGLLPTAKIEPRRDGSVIVRPNPATCIILKPGGMG